MVNSLNIQTVYTNFTNPAPTLFNDGGSTSFKMQIPQSTVMVSKPLSYQFRVAEYVNEKDEVVKVGLQVAVCMRGPLGPGEVLECWPIISC